MASRSRRFEPPRSLVGRSLLASVSALLLVMALIGGAIAAALALQTEPFSWEGPESQEAHITDALRFTADGRLASVDLPARTVEAFDVLARDMAFQVLDSTGAEVFASPPGPALDALRRVPPQAAARATRTTVGAVPLQVLTTPIERGAQHYQLRNARSERLALAIRSSGSAIFYDAALGTALLAVLVFSTISLWMARRNVRPLKEASLAAASIQPGNLTQRVDSGALPSEVTPLVDAFNGALDRLEQGYRVQQEFLAAAAHELKTPLTLMRAEIELGNVANLSLLLEDIDSMANQVQQLLQLAEVSELQNFKFEPLEIRAALEETVAYAARLAGSKDVHLRLAVDGTPPRMAADGGAFSSLVKNLIENAVHHSTAGGVVTIRLSGTGLAVRDEGPGVAPHDVPKLFTRFWRGEGALHQGAGLGLSICQRIATAHGWTLAYRDASPGPGAEFTLAFAPLPDATGPVAG